MMRVPVTVGKSSIHGVGVFATSPIKHGAVLWQFEPGLDQRISEYSVKFGEKRIQDFVRERGYINPDQPQVWVICVDESQHLNFPKKDELANLCLGGLIDGEYLLLAARDIEANEELTVPPESDLDFARKMQNR